MNIGKVEEIKLSNINCANSITYQYGGCLYFSFVKKITLIDSKFENNESIVLLGGGVVINFGEEVLL